MKLKILISLLSVLVMFNSCGDRIEMDTHLLSYKKLSKHFSDPPSSYRTVPFWVWNGKVTKKVIDEQIRAFADKGYGGVFVHPRYGLITEYASDEWYDLVAYALKRARKEGMDLWLYDENSFPSGFAGGHVPAEMPESYNKGHALSMERQQVLLPDSTKEYLLVHQITDTVLDITDSIDQRVGERGEFLLFEKVYYPVRDWYAGFSYVDLIYPGVAEKFIEVTMTGYEEKIGKHFGGSVPGVFTDEPNIAPQGAGDLIRWTPDLFDRFEEKWGYNLEPHLHALLEKTDHSYQVRHNYYQLLLDLFIERWSKPWYKYTEEKELAWTGHYWEHGWPSPHHGGDNMAMYAWHQVPGIDMLFNTWDGRPDQFGNVRAVRELNSVANQLGRVRKLSETYGAAGWELTFEDMKRNGDWEYVLGVNLMNQHLSYQTLVGDRKHDFPQSFSYHAPYWNEIEELNDYFARLSLALSSGHQLNRTLVLEPTTSAWMHYAPGSDNEYLKEIDDEFRTLLNLLEDEQIEYDLASERILRDHASLEENHFVVGMEEYNYVVIPKYLTNLNRETAELIEEYIERGGNVVALCNPPQYIDGERSDLFIELSSEHADHWLSIAGCNDPRLINYLRTEDFGVVERTGGTLYHMRRQLEDGQLLFLVNSSRSEYCYARMVSYGKDLVHMNLFTGDLENYPCVLSDDILSYDAELPPGGSILLFIGEDDIKGKKVRLPKWNREGVKVELGEIDIEVLEENALNLDYCSVTMGEDSVELDYFYPQQTRIFRKYGFDKNPWVSASQFKTEIIDKDTFPEGSGFIAEYPFFVDGRFKSRDLRIAVEKPGLYTVSFNGKPLERVKDNWWLDRNIGVYRIRDGIVAGKNTITIEADPMSVHCELEPIYVLGDFDVVALDTGWLVTNTTEKGLGSWKEMGLPFYSNKVSYKTSFEIDSRMPAKLVLSDWNGTVAEVTVNGTDAGLIYSEPYELRLDSYLERGINEITVTVTGSLKNLLGPHHNVSRKGIVTPWSFKYAPKEQPSGTAYDLEDYGLMRPFEIWLLE